MIDMIIEPINSVVSTSLTIGNLKPDTIYYKYQDDYHNLETFTTDAAGSYTYIQDLSQLHHVFIQPRPSTKFIKDDATGGDCNLIGSWDSATKTCTLDINVAETIQIDSNNIILDCNGHSITGTGTGNGIYLSSKSGVTVKNCNVAGFSYGIRLYSSSNNTITGNTASSNTQYGIYLYVSSNYNNVINNTVNNTVSNNGAGIMASGSYNTISNNQILNNIGSGISFGAHYNTISNNTISGNDHGIYLAWGGSRHNLISNNIIVNSTGVSSANYAGDGIAIAHNAYKDRYMNNTITNNIITNNAGWGIYGAEEWNILNNTIMYNSNGIIVFGQSRILNNQITNTSGTGIYLLRGKNNTVSNNNLLDNKYGIITNMES